MKTAESILTALSVPVLVLDESLRAVLANPAFHKTLRIAPRQLKGKSVEEFITGESGEPRLMAILDAVVTSDSSVEDVEIECTVPPRTRKFLKVNARLLHMEEGLTKRVLVELRDITHEKEWQQRIQELNEALQQHGVDLEGINKELDAFTQSVSHDLRTPLRLTNKVAHLLLEEDGAQLPASAIEKTHMILDSTQQMGHLIEDLLAFSRVGREPIRKRHIDTGRLAREALAEQRDSQQDRDVEVLIDELPPCRADRALLKQVFLNLLANALKFTRLCEHPKIRVGFTETNGKTVYFVRDNGVGFDMSHSESIFLAFHRLNRAQDFEGSGVGLALVKRVIERHNGRIWAESEKGRGATFYFALGE
ncbi:MAG: ATP-binding protein [Candidatus Hydrogenedentota bacterium]